MDIKVLAIFLFVATLAFLVILLCIRKVRVFTFATSSLPKLQEEINDFIANKCSAHSIESIVIREGESQYYGYITWRGSFFDLIPTDVKDKHSL